MGTTPKKIKSKKWDFVPFSIDPYPPTIKRDIFDFIFTPYQNRDIFEKKLLCMFIFNYYKLHILQFWALAQELAT